MHILRWRKLSLVSAEENLCASFHVVGNPYVGADDGFFANRDAPEDGGVGVNDDAVFEDGVARNVLDGVAGFVERKTLCAQGDSLVELDVCANDARGTDDYARAVVDGEVGTDLGCGVNVDARFAMGHFCDDARNEGHT